MDGSDFTQLLDLYAAQVIWQQAFPCPCTLSTGAADRACRICSGTARYYADPSDPLEVALLNQSARQRADMAQTMGPGQMGDATVVIFEGSRCYREVSSGDRFWDLERIDHQRLILIPGTTLTLPPTTTELTGWCKSADGTRLVGVPAPVPDGANRVTVLVGTRLDFLAARGYEVVTDLAKVRTFGADLPKRLMLKLLDLTIR